MKNHLYRMYDDVTETTSGLLTHAAVKERLRLWRDRFARLADMCLGTRFLEAVMWVTVLVSCSIYVWRSYLMIEDPDCMDGGLMSACPKGTRDEGLKYILAAVDITAASVLALEFLVVAVIRPTVANYVATPKGILDVLTISPIMQYSRVGEAMAGYVYSIMFGAIGLAIIYEFVKTVLYGTRADILNRHFVVYCGITFLAAFLSFYDSEDEDDAGLNFHFGGIMKVCTAARVLLLQRVLARTATENNELAQAIASFFLDFFGIIFIATSLMFEVSRLFPDSFNYGTKDNEYGMTWHESLYFVIITLTTVGYGDYSPNSTRTQLLVASFVVVCFLFIPEQVSKMHLIAAGRKEFRKPYKPSSIYQSHVVVCGNLCATTVERFVEEFLSIGETFSGGVTMSVLLAPELDPSLKVMMKVPKYKKNTHFICGSPQTEGDLTLARAHQAQAIFLLANVQNDAQIEENSVLLSAISIEKFCRRHPKTTTMPQMVAQTSTLQGEKTLKHIGIHMPICIDYLKSSILSFGMNFPGFIPFFFNIMRSEAAAPVVTRKGHETAPWLQEYTSGSKNEIFVLELDEVLNEKTKEGRLLRQVLYRSTWPELVGKMFNYNATLIGFLEAETRAGTQTQDLVRFTAAPRLNPGPAFQFSDEVTALYTVASSGVAAVEAVRQSLRDFVDEESDDEHDIYAEEGNEMTEEAEEEIESNISRVLAALAAQQGGGGAEVSPSNTPTTRRSRRESQSSFKKTYPKSVEEMEGMDADEDGSTEMKSAAAGSGRRQSVLERLSARISQRLGDNTDSGSNGSTPSSSRRGSRIRRSSLGNDRRPSVMAAIGGGERNSADGPERRPSMFQSMRVGRRPSSFAVRTNSSDNSEDEGMRARANSADGPERRPSMFQSMRVGRRPSSFAVRTNSSDNSEDEGMRPRANSDEAITTSTQQRQERNSEGNDRRPSMALGSNRRPSLSMGGAGRRPSLALGADFGGLGGGGGGGSGSPPQEAPNATLAIDGPASGTVSGNERRGSVSLMSGGGSGGGRRPSLSLGPSGLDGGGGSGGRRPSLSLGGGLTGGAQTTSGVGSDRRPSIAMMGDGGGGGGGGGGGRRPSLSFSTLGSNNGRRGSFTGNGFATASGQQRRGSITDRRGSIAGRRDSLGGASKFGNTPTKMAPKRPLRGRKAILLVPDSAIKYAAMFIIKFTSVQNRPILICHQKSSDYEVIVAEIRRILDDDASGQLFGYLGDNWFKDHKLTNAVGSLTDPKFLGGKKVNLRESHGVVAFANRGTGGLEGDNRVVSGAAVDQECILIGCALEQVIDNGAEINDTFEEEECDEEENDQKGGMVARRKGTMGGSRRGSIFAEQETTNEVFFMYELSDHQNIRYFRQYNNERGFSEEDDGAALETDSEFQSHFFQWPQFAAGGLCTHTILDTMLVRLAIHPAESAFWKAFFDLDERTFTCELIPSYTDTHWWEPPEGEENRRKTYGDLFHRYLKKEGNIVMGLFRPSSTLGSLMPYAHTNPPADTELVENDRMFVLKFAKGAAAISRRFSFARFGRRGSARRGSTS